MAVTAPSSKRLASRHTQALRDIAFGVEEGDAGICTRYLVDEDGFGPEDPSAIRLFDGDRVLDTYEVFGAEPVTQWRKEIKRARKALARMQSSGDRDSAAILRIAYGPEDPSTRDWPETARRAFGPELVSLVRYTDATEEVRKALVRRETFERLARVPDLVVLRRYEAYLDRIITSGDACREAFRPCREAEDGESPEEYAAYAKHHTGRLAAYIQLARCDADRMLLAASAAYHREWLKEI